MDTFLFLRCCITAAACALPLATSAFTVGIAPGAKAIYLRVGAGTYTLAYYQSGGTGGTTNVISEAQAIVSAANLGQGAVAMVPSNSPGESYFDGTVICNVASQVYVGGYYRASAGSGSATLSVTSPAALTTAGSDTLSFSTVSWTVTTRAGFSPDIANGSFNPGTTQFLRSVPSNTYFEDCLAFSYANSSPLVRAGTYSGRVTYTLVVP